MTHPETEVGGANDTVVAAEPTIEDRFGALADQPAEELPAEAPAEAEQPQPELAPEDVTEEPEAETGDDAKAPPIKPPVSWTAEEQEEFKSLPRTLQETLTRREGEREKFVQSKAQEAKQARSQVESEARAAFQRIQDSYTSQLQALMPQVAPQPASSMLDVNSPDYDPDQYRYQMRIHQDSLAQHQWVQQQLQTIQSQRTRAEQAAREQALQQQREALQEQLPEWFDTIEGPKLQQTLSSIALELGYSAEQLNDADANDILSLKRASDWKAKADRYDTLMAQKMERVRAAKELPRVSKPGVPAGKGQIANERYTADRQAMKNGDRDAAARVFRNFI